MDWFITVCIAVLLLWLIWSVSTPGSNASPPGPRSLPFVGNLFYIARQHPVNFIALHKISKKYGDVVSFKIGSMSNILISTCECARDLYSRLDCLNRPVNGAIWDRMLNQNIGMAFSNDEGWNSIRKFTSRSLREYGFGNKMAMEKLVKDELVNLVKFIDEKMKLTDDGVLHFDKFFQISFLNLMSSMIFGEKHSYEDEKLQNLVRASNKWFETPLLGVLTVMAFPWTRYVCPNVLGYTRQMDAIKEMLGYAMERLEEHRQRNNYLEEPKCFADSFLKMAHESKNDPSSIFTDDQFGVLSVDLMQGGADTTSNWLGFAILLLMIHPEVQEKVVEEISQVIGFDRPPESKDRDKMIYTQAVMYEVHRFARLTVIMPPRRASEDFEYRNYKIKKGTTIMVNLHSCFMDPDIWGDAEIFRPERFIDSEHNQLMNTDKILITFGAGRRICFGEPLAKESSFLYLTTLLQNFSFNTPPSPKYKSTNAEPIPGIILSPKPYYVQIDRRHRLTYRL